MTFETADVTDSDIHRTRKMSVISMVDSRKDSTGEYSPPANDSPSNERSNDNNKVWLYEENNKKLYTMDGNPSRGVFLDEFFEYRRKRGLYCKIPVIARKPLDVFVLYNIVQKYGGFEQTLKNRMWSQIARELDLPRTMTSGAFTLKLKYIRLLYQFECHVIGKPVNQSILLNDAFIGETPNSSEQSETQSEYMMRTRLDATSPRATSLPSSPPSGVFSRSDSYHSTEEQGAYTEYTRAKTEKEYRDALMGAYGGQKRKESSNGNGYTTKVNGRNDSDGAYPYYIREQRPHKSPSLDYRQSNSPHLLKRKMLDSPPPPPPSSAPRRSVSLANFSVDVLQVGEGKISLKVLMNNEIYEGELFSITPDSPYST